MKRNNKSISRREALMLGGQAVGVGAVASLAQMLMGCSPKAQTFAGTETTDSTSVVPGGSCSSIIPSETAGPYPAHDDSAINCLRFSGIVRSDIRGSLNTGGYTGTAMATGIPLTLTLTLSDTNCAPHAGYAIYLWHCDVNGKYSMYSSGITNQTYLRGVQQTDANGRVTFTTIFPGCYDGRMPHMHFEIYPTLGNAVDDYYAVKTSQLTFPMDSLNAVYNTSAYSASKTNLTHISYATDNVFSDGYSNQVVNISGDVTNGYAASLLVAI